MQSPQRASSSAMSNMRSNPQTIVDRASHASVATMMESWQEADSTQRSKARSRARQISAEESRPEKQLLRCQAEKNGDESSKGEAAIQPALSVCSAAA